MTDTPRYFVRADEVASYSPANHAETRNRRLIGPETVGARNIEMVLGEVAKGGGALAHSHPGIEQVVYVLEGRARAEIDGHVHEVGPGDTCYFPPGAPHVFTAISDEPLKCLVIYSPPYGESAEKGVAR